MVVIGMIIWTTLIACVNGTPNLSSVADTVGEITNPNQVAEGATVKIEISTDDGEHISSGVIVGDGSFAVTYAPEISAESTKAKVTHVRSKVVTAGSIIYIDEIFGLILIQLTDDTRISVGISQSIPNLGEKLIIGDFLPVGGKDLAISRYSTVAGFEFEGLIIRFDGIGGIGNVGGPVFNKKGQLVGIVTHGLGEGESGSAMSPETFKYGLAEELVRYSEVAIGNASILDLELIGIPAHVTKPSDWNIVSGFGYFDIRAPGSGESSEDQSSDGYKVIGIINAYSSAEETSEAVLDRAIAELGDAFERVSEFDLPDQPGLDSCSLLMTVEEYAQTAFERRGHVMPGGWVSNPGIYTGLCTGVGRDQRVIVFAESQYVDDIVNGDGLFNKIVLLQ